MHVNIVYFYMHVSFGEETIPPPPLQFTANAALSHIYD